MDMTLQQLHYFRILAEIQHYTRAAEALMISQPSLSLSISDLEKELGAKLFKRTGKRINLSDEGKIFLKYIETALDSIEKGKYEVQKFSEESKSCISIGYIFSISRDVQNILLGFQMDYEDWNINIKHTLQHSNDLILDMLAADRADIVFCTDPPENIESKKIFDQELFFAVGREHLLAKEQKPVTEEMLRNESLVMLSENVSIHYAIERFFKERGMVPKISCVADECNAAAAYVAAGYGYAIIPNLPGLEPSGVKLLDSGEFSIKRPIYMAWKKGRVLSPNAERLKEYIFKMYGEI